MDVFYAFPLFFCRSSMMPVHVAALCISAAVTETLIHHGCDVNATTNDERTPLHVLAEFGAASPKETSQSNQIPPCF